MTSPDAMLAAYRQTKDAVERELPLRISLIWTIVFVIASFAPIVECAAWAAMMTALFVLEAALFRRFFIADRAEVDAAAKARFAVASLACSIVYCWPALAFYRAGTPEAYFAAAAFVGGALIHLLIYNSATSLIFASASAPIAVIFFVLGAALSVRTGTALPLMTVLIFLSAIFTAYLSKAAIERRLRDALAEANAARRAAERASAAKSNFLAKVTHELRTPLNGVIGLAEALAGHPRSEEERRTIAAISECGEALLDMVDKTLDHANLDAAPVRLDAAPADLRDLLGAVVEANRRAAAAKGLALSLDLAELDAPRVVVDGERLSRALGHLLSNAVKFTQSGAVLVKAKSRRGTRGVDVAIEVSDTGCGVGPEDRERIFLPFEQADNSTTRAHAGVGLGLAIARAIAEAMGGSLTLRPTTAPGATFRLEIRAEAAPIPQPNEENAAAPAPSGGPRILLVEDNPVNRQVVKAMLGPLKAEIVEAENGAQALDRLKEERFDVVLMDIHMPVMDGLAATRAIRASGASYARVPIVAITAAASPEDRSGCFDAGVDEFLAKPVRLDALSSLVKRYASAAKAA